MLKHATSGFSPWIAVILYRDELLAELGAACIGVVEMESETITEEKNAKTKNRRVFICASYGQLRQPTGLKQRRPSFSVSCNKKGAG